MSKIEPFLIGTYQLGYRWVNVFAEPESCSGSFTWHPNNNTSDHSEIRVGMAGKGDEPYAVLLHEVIEATCADLGTRFRKTSVYVESASDAYQFFFCHSQFTEIAARTAWFLWQINQDFKAALDLIRRDS